MNTDNLITPESLAASLKMAAEGMKKKPGSDEVHRGLHGTAQHVRRAHRHGQGEGQVRGHPRHPAAPRDLRGDGRGGRLQRVLGRHLRRRGGEIRARGLEHLAVHRHAERGLLVLPQHGRPAARRQVAQDRCLCLRHLVVRQRQGVPHAGPALRHPRLRHGAALPPVHAAGDGALARRAQAPDRLPGREDRQEAGLRPPEGDGAPVLPPHRAGPRDRRSQRPCADADVRRMLRRRAAGAAADVRHPGGGGLPGIAEGGARGTHRQRRRRRPERAFPGDLEQLSPRSGTPASWASCSRSTARSR